MTWSRSGSASPIPTSKTAAWQIIPGTHKEPDYVHVETYAADNLLARGQTIEEIDDLEGGEA